MHNSLKENQYYLPLTYNDSKIVLLVRDPYCIFAYWEISNEKRDNFIRQFGQNSWDNSKTVIKLTNITTFKIEYIEIDGYANNWYINVNQPNCIFKAELGRMLFGNNFISLITSNAVHTPSDKVTSVSPVVFANYKDLRTAKKIDFKPDLGKYEYVFDDYASGLSSALLSGLSGVSSDSFIKK